MPPADKKTFLTENGVASYYAVFCWQEKPSAMDIK